MIKENIDTKGATKESPRNGGLGAGLGASVLVTGANGFVGRNLCAELKNVRDGKARCYGGLKIGRVMEYDVDTDPGLLEEYCREADFVYNLAGVNRPERTEEFMEGNYGFASTLLDTLRRVGNRCPVMLSSSIQASLEGRYAGSEYGKSKLAGEELFFAYGRETGARVLVYRLPNLFGKWCRPNYNSAVATFCHNLAHDLPIRVNDASVELELLYVDDLVRDLIGRLTDSGSEERYCTVSPTYRVTLGEIVGLLEEFKAQPRTLMMPEIAEGSFAKKLYSTFLSYLPADKVVVDLKMNCDERGSFTELLKTRSGGQFSVNVSLPGIKKGEHWHHTKWELFIVVSGQALIQMRRIGTDEVLEYRVSGERIQAVHMLPGYTHNIINLSEREPLVTLMWANEAFDPGRPDTYFEPVERNETDGK